VQNFACKTMTFDVMLGFVRVRLSGRAPGVRVQCRCASGCGLLGVRDDIHRFTAASQVKTWHNGGKTYQGVVWDSAGHFKAVKLEVPPARVPQREAGCPSRCPCAGRSVATGV